MSHLIVILTLACISFVSPFLPYLCSYIELAFPERSIDRHLSLSDCHVLSPMRHLSRTSSVLARPRPLCLDSPCVLSRPLSSFELANASEHLHPPVTDHVSRFDWRRHVPSPKPPLSTFQKVLEKRTQPPLPAYSHSYDSHIQKYKAQSVTTSCSRPVN